MPTILLVDDTDFDRQVAAHLLQDVPDAVVCVASCGADALALLTTREIDLVVSDLRMPGMSGLDLLDRMREEHPLVPVVIMTSQGSEELAVDALRRGAASYVPKANLPRDLASTAATVLEAAARRRGESLLMDCLAMSHQQFEIPNDRTLVPRVVGCVQETLARLGLCDDRARTRVGVAMEEALVNAIVHGNLEVSSELRERADDSFSRLVESRRRQLPYAERRVTVVIRATPDEAAIIVRDEGPGFDVSKLPDPTDPENLVKCSGRGILLMRAFLDEVAYNETGNEVTMTKRRGGEQPVPTSPHRRTTRRQLAAAT